MTEFSIKSYHTTLQHKGITPDLAQEKILEKFAKLTHALLERQSVSGWKRHLIPVPKGIYLWGGVGRGKTLLMDLFFNNLPENFPKKRKHFHEWMLEIHQKLHKLSGVENPVDAVIQSEKDTRVLCLDECFVDDVADALILKNLFQALAKQGTTIILTSNIHPDELYLNGVQRNLFLKAIDVLKRNCEIVELDNQQDYRVATLSHQQHFFNLQDNDKLSALFNKYATGTILYNHAICIAERTLIAKAIAHEWIWFDFHTLCETERSNMDYIEISAKFKTLIISEVPILKESDMNAARRFIHLIDILYDNRNTLFISAEAPVENLYQGKIFSKEFIRTRSRLREMVG